MSHFDFFWDIPTGSAFLPIFCPSLFKLPFAANRSERRGLKLWLGYGVLTHFYVATSQCRLSSYLVSYKGLFKGPFTDWSTSPNLKTTFSDQSSKAFVGQENLNKYISSDSIESSVFVCFCMFLPTWRQGSPSPQHLDRRFQLPRLTVPPPTGVGGDVGARRGPRLLRGHRGSHHEGGGTHHSSGSAADQFGGLLRRLGWKKDG